MGFSWVKFIATWLKWNFFPRRILIKSHPLKTSSTWYKSKEDDVAWKKEENDFDE